MTEYARLFDRVAKLEADVRDCFGAIAEIAELMAESADLDAAGRGDTEALKRLLPLMRRAATTPDERRKVAAVEQMFKVLEGAAG